MKRALLLLALVGCDSPTAPSDVPSTWVDTVEFEWAAAVDELTAANVPGWKVAAIKWHDFTWREHPGPFTCGDVEDARGCYTTGWDMIEWSALHPTALRHEIKHGILHKLQYGCWRCVDHGCTNGPATCPVEGEDNGS